MAQGDESTRPLRPANDRNRYERNIAFLRNNGSVLINWIDIPAHRLSSERGLSYIAY